MTPGLGKPDRRPTVRSLKDPQASRAANILAERGGVLFIMNSLSQGGGDRVAVLLANGFARAGIPVRVVLMRDMAEPALKSMLLPEVHVESAGAPMGLKLTRTGQPLGHRHFERFRGVRLVRKFIDERSPAVVLGATDNMALTAALVRRPKDDQVLFAFKLTNRLSRPTIGRFRRFYRYHLFKFIFDRMDLVLTLSRGERSHVLDVHPGREGLLCTVPNPYVTDAMLMAKRASCPGPRRLVAAGRMVPQKRFDVLLRAFARLQDVEAELTILGDGPLRQELVRLCDELGISDRVHLPGYVSDITPELLKSDLFVLSSDYEGLPAVVIEALAANVPVATTESFFAAKELLNAEPTCAVVPIGDPDALADGMRRCLSVASQPDLKLLAEPYRIERAVTAHMHTLAEAVLRQKRAEIPV